MSPTYVWIFLLSYRLLLKDNTGVQVGTSVHVSDLAYVGDIVLLSNNYREMQRHIEAVDCQHTH